MILFMTAWCVGVAYCCSVRMQLHFVRIHMIIEHVGVIERYFHLNSTLALHESTFRHSKLKCTLWYLLFVSESICHPRIPNLNNVVIFMLTSILALRERWDAPALDDAVELSITQPLKWIVCYPSTVLPLCSIIYLGIISSSSFHFWWIAILAPPLRVLKRGSGHVQWFATSFVVERVTGENQLLVMVEGWRARWW